MVFSSSIFLLLFLPVVFLGNLLISRTGRIGYSNIFLLAASLFFYAWGEPLFVLVMIVSIIINHLVGKGIDRSLASAGSGTPGSRRTESEGADIRTHAARMWLVFGIVCDLALLGVFKYTGFAVRTLNSLAHRELLQDPGITLPIGISFFTFQAVSYIIDVYRKDTEVSDNIVNTALYISFFPQLIAGPIVKYHDINKQIIERSVTAVKVADGFKRFIYGLGKKVLIANVLARCADAVYGFEIADVDWKMAWIGALAYTFQIYYDFSGYSDMAIGLGQMFGFDIPENFNYPYLSSSISEFWRRWHISLGSWFREYVYIPLGGNRKGTVRTYINLTTVFFLTGLWHGAGVSFIVWGLYHGFFSMLERVISSAKRKADDTQPENLCGRDIPRGRDIHAAFRRAAGIIYTFAVVNFGWVMFRASSMRAAAGFLIRMVMPWRYTQVRYSSWHYMGIKTVFIGVCAVIGAGLLTRIIPEKIKERYKGSVTEAVYCAAIFLISLAAVVSDTYNPFIYYQF